MTDAVALLRSAIGTDAVLTDPDLLSGYTTDWTGRYSGDCLAVVRPRSTEDVARILAVCDGTQTPVVPQGGNTGLVGGSIPFGRSQPLPVVLSTKRLGDVGPVDRASWQVTVGAGVTLESVQSIARSAGLYYGVDLAARGSATIGGTVATNAGGIRVIAYGMTRAHIVGVEAVMPGGAVVSRLSGLAKDNCGYDLAGLLCGSEGTLGVITAVRLQLQSPPGATSLALVGLTTMTQVVEALELTKRASTRGRGRLLAAEVMDGDSVSRLCALRSLPWPLERRWPYLLLVEVEDGGQAAGLPLDDYGDVVVATDTAQRARLWGYREQLPELFAGERVLKLDVSVPVSRLPDFVAAIEDLIGRGRQVQRWGVLGHVGDGNLHVQLVEPADESSIDHDILVAVARFGGSISAEHGIGRQKASKLNLSRSGPDIAIMKAIKLGVDPRGIMNPGVLFA